MNKSGDSSKRKTLGKLTGLIYGASAAVFLSQRAMAQAHPQSHQIAKASELKSALEERQKYGVTVLAFFTSPGCPWCVSVRREQLEPRLLAADVPAIRIVEINMRGTVKLPFLNGITEAEWSKKLNIKLAPTVVAVEADGTITGTPLVGYPLRDFYGAYLEEQITQAIKGPSKG